MGFAFNIRTTAVWFLLAAGLGRADSLLEALQSKRFQDALAFTDALLARNPHEPKALRARGMALAGLRRNQESLAAFQEALQAAPNFVPALQGASEVSYRSRDPRAAGFLNRLIQASPENGVAQAMAGVLAFESGKCSIAIQHFERGLGETMNNDQAYPLYGACLLKADRPQDAVRVFAALVARHPSDSPDLLNFLAAAEIATHQYDFAAGHLRRAIAAAPTEEKNYVDLAALYMQQEHLDAASQAVGEGLSNLPGSARLHSLLGVIHAQTGKVDEAAADFALANQLDAGQEYGAAGLGLLYTETRKTDLAVSVLRGRLKKAPEDVTLNYLLAQAIASEPVEAGSTQFLEARQALEKSLRGNPNFTRAHTLLGKLYAQVGENQKALEQLKLAAKQDHTDRTALSQLAIVLRRLGRTEEASVVVADLRTLLLQSTPPVLARTP